MPEIASPRDFWAGTGSVMVTADAPACQTSSDARPAHISAVSIQYSLADQQGFFRARASFHVVTQVSALAPDFLPGGKTRRLEADCACAKSGPHRPIYIVRQPPSASVDDDCTAGTHLTPLLVAGQNHRSYDLGRFLPCPKVSKATA